MGAVAEKGLRAVCSAQNWAQTVSFDRTLAALNGRQLLRAPQGRQYGDLGHALRSKPVSHRASLTTVKPPPPAAGQGAAQPSILISAVRGVRSHMRPVARGGPGLCLTSSHWGNNVQTDHKQYCICISRVFSVSSGNYQSGVCWDRLPGRCCWQRAGTKTCPLRQAGGIHTPPRRWAH